MTTTETRTVEIEPCGKHAYSDHWFDPDYSVRALELAENCPRCTIIEY